MNFKERKVRVRTCTNIFNITNIVFKAHAPYFLSKLLYSLIDFFWLFNSEKKNSPDHTTKRRNKILNRVFVPQMSCICEWKMCCFH